MTEYSELVKALRCKSLSKECDSCDYGYHLSHDSECNDACHVEQIYADAAAAIEELWADNDILHQHIEDMNEAFRDKSVECQKAAKRNAELHAELEKWVSAAEKAGEPKLGEWELIDGAEPMRWGCSRCKYLSWETSNYCPRCGARMEGMDASRPD